MSNPLRGAIVFFTLAFGVYLWTMPPTLPAYRDAGEMAASAETLGVSHPPSYPLYILAGHAAMTALPLGRPAYRLTVFSALAAAGTLAALFYWLAASLGAWPAAGAVVLLGCNATFWSVAVVPEMYSLTLLCAAILLLLASRLREEYRRSMWYGFALFYGLSLGNRTDLLLWAPGLFLLALWSSAWRRREAGRLRWFVRSLVFAGLGLSIYLYLPLRSMRGPWLDWNHPATLENLIGSLTRRSYGGTLDLLSKSYATGENFLANMEVYARHLWSDFLGLAVPLVFAGLWRQFRRDRELCGALALAYAASGPVFLFLANMPPNPHALAIVEPHYLLSDLILAIWAAEGLAALRLSSWKTALAVLALSILPWARGQGLDVPGGQWSRVDRRWTFTDYDWCRNVFRSVPPGAVLVAKKDVQLFSLWYHQTVEGRRPDVRLVAQGLSGSSWYQASKRRLGSAVWLSPLHSPEEWREFVSANGGRVYATMDAELPAGLAVGPPRALVLRISTQPWAAAEAGLELPWRFIVRRGEFRYDRQPDFFNSDLIESYATAREREGDHLAEHGAWEASLRPLYFAWSWKWAMPETATLLGFSFFRMGQAALAGEIYGLAIGLYEDTIAQTVQFHSLPGVASSIKRGAAEAHLNLGVIREKLGDKQGAEGHYRESIRLAPGYAEPHYNLAVLYWGKDWDLAVREMEEALRLEPSRADIVRYLALARERLKTY